MFHQCGVGKVHRRGHGRCTVVTSRCLLGCNANVNDCAGVPWFFVLQSQQQHFIGRVVVQRDCDGVGFHAVAVCSTSGVVQVYVCTTIMVVIGFDAIVAVGILVVESLSWKARGWWKHVVFEAVDRHGCFSLANDFQGNVFPKQRRPTQAKVTDRGSGGGQLGLDGGMRQEDQICDRGGGFRECYV